MATKLATRARIRTGAAALAFGGAMALVGCSTSVDGEAVASSSSSGGGTTTSSSSERETSTTTSSEPQEVDVFDLTVGDCIIEDLGGLGDDSVTVEGGQRTVPCSEPHTFEVYAEHRMSGSTFPGEEAAIDEASEECSLAFEPFVGMDYNDSELELFYLYPTKESWADGDRIVTCLIGDPSGTNSGTLRGANR